jgi:acyl-CoA synthetase (AMP-forming)/AMP-acid ligase II
MVWNFEQYSHNTAIVDESGYEVTYFALNEECSQLYATVGKRCLVFCLCANVKGSLLAYVAFVNNYVVPLMLDSGLDRELLSSLIENYKPDYLWLPSAMVGEFGYAEQYSTWDYSLIKTGFDSEYLLYDELALLLTTSGSTGSPKFVRQSYRNIEANTRSIVEYLLLDETERPITTMPMSYTYGLSIVNSHLWVGASIILTQKTLMQREFWIQFKKYGATSFGGVPYIYEMLDKLRFYRLELPTLRSMTQAGGKLSPELHKKFAEYAEQSGKKFIVMYGQTEATARMSYLPAKKSLEKYGSMGIAIPNGEFSLIDVYGNMITKPETIGELVYRGENVTLGYAESGEDLSKGDERGGVLVTGDMAKYDADGYYYIVGRKKRFLKIFGSRVNLDETERMIKTKFDLDCACVGVDDRMSIYITSEAVLQEVKSYVSGKTGLNPIAFNVRCIDEIPKSESGKTLYTALEKKENSMDKNSTEYVKGS